MATIYRLRYWEQGDSREENYAHKADATRRFDEVLGLDTVSNVELFRQIILRPSLDLVLRILNQQPYVESQKMILVGKLSRNPIE